MRGGEAEGVPHPLRELREALGLNQSELADAIGRSHAFICMIESGQARLGRETVLAVMDRYRPVLNRLGITAEDLLRGSRSRRSGAAA